MPPSWFRAAALPARLRSAFRESSRPALLASGAVLFLVTLAVFWSVQRNDFVSYDDNVYVTQVPGMSAGLSWPGIRWACTSTDMFWIPVTRLSYLLDYQLAGLDPGRFHQTNLLLHAANAVLLSLLIFRTTGRVWTGFLIALLFALHPLRVESVAWISERRDVLSAFFALLSLLAYVRYCERPGAWRYAQTFLILALALLAKSMMVTVPLIFLLLDFWPLGRWSRLEGSAAGGSRAIPRSGLARLVAEKLPFLVLAFAVGLVTLKTQSAAGVKLSLAEIPVGPRVLTAIDNYRLYLEKSVWPSHLAVHYPHPYYPPPGAGIPPWKWGAGLVLLVAVSAACTAAARRRPFLVTGWWWFVGCLAPVIGMMQVGTQSIADRYTYFPSIGLSIAVGFLAAGLASRGPGRFALVVVVAIGVLGGFAAVTHAQIGHWRDSISLYRRAIAVSDNNVEMHYNLGCIYLARGRWKEAGAEFGAVLKFHPPHLPARLNLSACLVRDGNTAEAIRQLELAVAHHPGYAKAYVNLGILHRQEGRWERSLAMFEQAIALKPDDGGAYFQLAISRERLGLHEQAREALEQAARLDPNVDATRQEWDPVRLN